MFQIFFAYVGKDSFVHQVLETCLKVTVKECVAQYPSGMIIAAVRIDILLQYDFIAGQRTGLVGTKNVHGPEVLDGIEILHDRFFFDIDTAPFERFAVTIIGSISGVNPTATDKANMNASNQSPFVKPLTKKTNGTITNIKRISKKLTLLIPLSKAVVARSPTKLRAIVPR